VENFRNKSKYQYKNKVMKTKIIVVLCVLSLSFLSFKTLAQEIKSAVAIYDGYEYEEYNFSISGGGDNDDTYIAFSEISVDILKSFNLNSEELIGETFKMTYQIIPEKETEDGEFTDQVYVLKSLEIVN
jgi:hypothetical protein